MLVIIKISIYFRSAPNLPWTVDVDGHDALWSHGARGRHEPSIRRNFKIAFVSIKDAETKILTESWRISGTHANPVFRDSYKSGSGHIATMDVEFVWIISAVDNRTAAAYNVTAVTRGRHIVCESSWKIVFSGRILYRRNNLLVNWCIFICTYWI